MRGRAWSSLGAQGRRQRRRQVQKPQGRCEPACPRQSLEAGKEQGQSCELGAPVGPKAAPSGDGPGSGGGSEARCSRGSRGSHACVPVVWGLHGCGSLEWSWGRGVRVCGRGRGAGTRGPHVGTLSGLSSHFSPGATDGGQGPGDLAGTGAVEWGWEGQGAGLTEGGTAGDSGLLPPGWVTAARPGAGGSSAPPWCGCPGWARARVGSTGSP